MRTIDYPIGYISDYMYADVVQLRAENKSGKYKKLSDCPNYSRVQAYCNAINILVKEYYNDEYVEMYMTSPSKEINSQIRRY